MAFLSHKEHNMERNHIPMSEIELLVAFLTHLKIPFSQYPLTDIETTLSDGGIRDTLDLKRDALLAIKNIHENILKENTFFHLTDEFFCRYIFFLHPYDLEKPFCLIGPFLTEETQVLATEKLKTQAYPATWLPLLKTYYRTLPCLSTEEGLLAGLSTMADLLWGAKSYKTEKLTWELPALNFISTLPLDLQKRQEIFLQMENFENLYKSETLLLHAISQGHTQQAKDILNNMPVYAFDLRTAVLRNMKNYSIVLNTLFRRAAEQGGVHPAYIDPLSSDYVYRIELLSRSDNFIDLWMDMITKYCNLVKNHSIKNYSLPVQKIIIRIDLDLSADLSLKANADYLNMNPSYLSALFKRETGFNLTEYVNKKRIEYAAYLLISSDLSISNVAQNCGILDDNYFTKLFKKYYQLTPSQYKQQHLAQKYTILN